MEMFLILSISILGLLFALYLLRNVLKRDTGTPRMREISDAIKAGAEAFLRRQYRTIFYLSVALAALIYILYAFVRTHQEHDPAGPGALALWTTISFVFGALCSVAAGYMGMWVAIRSNIRTAAGALRSMNSALQPALRGGAVSGFFVVALSLLGVAGLFSIVQGAGVTQDITKIPLLIVGYGFGASFVALFAQLGGGIYTKAADVGADPAYAHRLRNPHDRRKYQVCQLWRREYQTHDYAGDGDQRSSGWAGGRASGCRSSPDISPMVGASGL